MKNNFIATGLFITLLFTGVIGVPQAQAHGIDSLIKTSDGTVYFIEASDNGVVKRPFTSLGALQSYGFLSLNNVVEADSTDLAYPTGSFIPPMDGTIFCATETKGTDVAGECSLITEGQKAAFTSAQVFAQQGYSFDRAIYGDSSFLSKTTDIADGSAAHRTGSLVNDNGTIYMNYKDSRFGIEDMSVVNSWGWNLTFVPLANAQDKDLTLVGDLQTRKPGKIEFEYKLSFFGETIVLSSILEEYPDYPTKLASSQAEAKKVKEFAEMEILTFDEFYFLTTDYSQYVFDLLPLFTDEVRAEFNNSNGDEEYSKESIKIYGDGSYAIYSFDDPDYEEDAKVHLRKENGEWKMDYIGTLKYAVSLEN